MILFVLSPSVRRAILRTFAGWRHCVTHWRARRIGNMPVADDDFRTLMAAVQQGSRPAVERLCREYQSHILRVVRRRLMRRLRVRYDSLDLVNDVWLSFFSRPSRKRRFDSPAALIAYLERMTCNKVKETALHALALKHSVDRESSVDGLAEYAVDYGGQPSPCDVSAAKEQFEKMLEGRPLHQQRILLLLRQGMTHREIAERLQTNEKTVQRLVRRLTRELTPHE